MGSDVLNEFDLINGIIYHERKNTGRPLKERINRHTARERETARKIIADLVSYDILQPTPRGNLFHMKEGNPFRYQPEELEQAKLQYMNETLNMIA